MMSIVKPRQKLTQLQSEKSVISVLTLSFSCIAFLRGFFNDEHFEDSQFVVDDRSSIKIKTLKKGMSKEADGLVQWINTAVSDGIKNKYLKAVSLSIILDPNDPTDIFENYTFKVEYKNNEGSLVFETEAFDAIKSTRQDICSLLRRFIVITQSLGNLPEKRWLSLRLLYNENCPDKYQPMGFEDCSLEKAATIKMPINDEGEQCGGMNSTYHSLNIKIMSLADVDINEHFQKANLDPFMEDTELNDNSDIEKSGVKIDNTGELSSDDMADKTLANDGMSQITKEFENLIKDKKNADTQSIAIATQKIDFNDIQGPLLKSNKTYSNLEGSINCQCNAKKHLSFSRTIQCQICSNYIHRTCYAIKRDEEINNFTCLTCLDEPITNDLKIIFNIRKILTLLDNKDRAKIKSLSKFCTECGYAATDKLNADNVVSAVTVLIFEGIINLKSRKSFFHWLFQIDLEGLLLKNLPVRQGKYFISAVTGAEKKKKGAKFWSKELGRASDAVEDSMQDDTMFENIEYNHYLDCQDEHTTNKENINGDYKRRKISKSKNVYSV
ncbi:Hop1 protein [Martiniozyma asiatica (nom. inval.)]|nr:Hop1 protein [Martiniozyma asiatica]